LLEAKRKGLLRATTDPADAVLNSEVSFVCVGTPSLKNGKLDLSHIEHVAREVGAAIGQKKTPHVFVLRSTVLAGTTETVVLPILEEAERQDVRQGFHGLL
jgi:GDP-mannose 6-dehydrogenase